MSDEPQEYEPLMGLSGPLMFHEDLAATPIWESACRELLRRLPKGTLIWSVTPTGLRIDPKDSP